MRQQAQYEPTIAELSAPKSKQPRNGGMSTKEIIQARLEAKSREKLRTEAKDEKSVAETLAWVRAKSAERRGKKLLAQFSTAEGKENNSSFGDDVAPLSHNPSPPRSSNDVTASIARGQQILKAAEGNMTAFEKYMTDMKSKKASAMKSEDDEEVTSTIPKFTEQPPLTTQSNPVSPERQDKDKYVLKNARTHNASSSLVYQKMATVPFDPEAFKGNVMSERLEGKFREMVGSVNLKEGEGVDVFRTSPRPSEKRQRTEEQGGEEGGEEVFASPSSNGPRVGHSKVTVMPSRKKTQESIEEEEMLLQMKKIKEDARRRTAFQAQQKQAEFRAKILGEDVLEEEKKRREVDFEILIREGEEIRRLEEEAKERRRRGGRAKVKEKEKNEDQQDQPKKQVYVQPFDPNTQLEGVRRAKEAAEKREHDIEEAEHEAAEKRKFKARPLPGGVHVQSNIHAMTEAQKAREIKRGRGRKGSRGGRKPPGPQRMDAADLFRKLDGFGGSIEQEFEEPKIELSVAEIKKKQEERKQARQQKRMQEKMNRDQEGILTLQEEIERLELKLGKGKFANQEKKEKEDVESEEEDDYLDAISGAGKMLKQQFGNGGDSTDSDSDGEELVAAKRPATFLTGTNIADEYDDGDDDDDSSSCSSASSVSSDDSNPPLLTIKPPAPSKKDDSGPASEVYRRQEKWLAEKERKRKALIAEKEKKAMEGFTGKPEVGSAKESWARAKAAHERESQRAKMMEDAKLKEKGDKERADGRRKQREIDGLRAQVRYKKKLRRMNVDKDKQRESLEKLAKPKNARSAAAELGIKDEGDLDAYRMREKVKAQQAEAQDTDIGGDDGFGDMDEKQYIKVMKALGLDPGITAKKKKKGLQNSEKVDKAKRAARKEIMNIDIGPLDIDENSFEQAGTSSLVNVGSVVNDAHPNRNPTTNNNANNTSPNRTDFRNADFNNDASVIKEIDDVFAELESDKWGAAVGGGEGDGEDEDWEDEEGDEEYQFEESADEDGVGGVEEEYEEKENGEERKWSFSGHTNNEGILSHAASALDAAEAALGGLLGGWWGEWEYENGGCGEII
ncbi:hypothetical protein TL16_g07923 [Triparma laevis f. inornata]|uniref:Uncharacterized protein n=1 Tax=Triparma laevis f. inornata TaxID=1714386 RepID=A0A9W7B1B7_9STRA|nr:hypothetical protein TL16_g07923 [Triparma laevis f. inornata]